MFVFTKCTTGGKKIYLCNCDPGPKCEDVVRTVHDFLREYQIEVEIAQKKAATDEYKI